MVRYMLVTNIPPSAIADRLGLTRQQQIILANAFGLFGPAMSSLDIARELGITEQEVDQEIETMMQLGTQFNAHPEQFPAGATNGSLLAPPHTTTSLADIFTPREGI